MNQLIIDDMPELYAKLKPYIDYLEGLGFYIPNHSYEYFKPGDKENYEYFNGWCYKRADEDHPDGYRNDWVVDLASYTNEPKIEVYTFKIEKKQKYHFVKEDSYPYIITNNDNGGVYDSKIVDNLKDFKKEIGKYLKLLKTYQERVKKHELDKDFA